MPTTHQKHPLSTALKAALFCVGLAGLTPAMAAQGEPQRYEIAAGSLAETLGRFASASGVALSFDAEQLGNRASPGLQGEFTVDSGFATLLAGSGLQAVRQGNGSYILLTSQSSGALELGATTVTGAQLGDTTEGTGSYTTGLNSTATGMHLSLRETPQSVTVITRQRMEDENLSSVGRVLDVTPGVSVVRAGASGSPAVGELFYARGFEITNYQLDGVPTNQLGLQAMAGTRSGIGGTSTAIYDQITVVRGATGLLTGAGNPAASINLTRKRPTAEFQGAAEVSVGRWDRYDTQLDLSGPLNAQKTLRGRMVAGSGGGGEWMERHEDAKNSVFYGVLEADIGPSTLFTLGLEHLHNEDQGISFNNFARVDMDGNRTHFRRTANASARWAYADVSRSNAFFSLDHQFDNQWQARLSVNHTRLDHDQVFGFARGDIDAQTGASSFEYGKTRYTPRTTGIEAHATGPFNLLGREHELMVGFNHEQLSASDPQYRYYFGVPIDNIYDLAEGGSIDVPNPEITGTSRTRIRQNGGYIATRLHPLDGLAIIAGARVSNYKLRTNYSDIQETGVATPYFGMVVDLTEQVSAYTSYTTIFNPQSDQDRNGQTLDPEEGKNYELGLKGEFFDGRMNASAALFATDKDNLALLDDGALTPQGDDAYVANDNTRARGYELEVSGELMPDWQLAAGFTQVTVHDKDGERLRLDISARQAKLFTSYTLPGDWRALTLGGGVSWQSRISHPYDDNPALRQGAVAVYNLMARYRFDTNLSASVNVANLTDKTYLSTVWYHNYGSPRNITATLRYQF